MIEQEVRYRIDRTLESNGWVLRDGNPGRNVFFEGTVKKRLPRNMASRLGNKRPDYTLFNGVQPLAIIEAKKSSLPHLTNALNQAKDYAERIGANIIFATNGVTFKSNFLRNNKPLYLNGVEVTGFAPLKILSKFQAENTNEVFTVSKEIIKSRTQLISLFSELNDDLRAAGIRAGIERFSEFANILFLKLLSEKGEDEIWNRLLAEPEDSLLGDLNNVVKKKLSNDYGGDVLADINIPNPSILKLMVMKLNPLHLTDVDEDIKGVAFEHFIQKTTDTQNDLSEYFTPRHIVRFMVRMLNPQFGKSVYDPFCGTGGFLTEAFKHISCQKPNTRDTHETLQKRTVFGGEITSTSRISKMNMILFGDGHSGVNQHDSLTTQTSGRYDNVLSNIPFSQQVSETILSMVQHNVGYAVKDADEACFIKCFDSLKDGGAMAIVVPEGLLVNRTRANFLRYIFQHSNVRSVVKLPRGCFAPYTDSKTGVIYLTDKGRKSTKWFYRVTIKNDGFDKDRNAVEGINDLERFLFFFQDITTPASNLPEDIDIGIVRIENLDSEESFQMYADWKVDDGVAYDELKDVAHLKNGKSITKKEVEAGRIPVIAGGKGSTQGNRI